MPLAGSGFQGCDRSERRSLIGGVDGETRDGVIMATILNRDRYDESLVVPMQHVQFMPDQIIFME